MNENIIAILIVYFIISAMFAGITLPIAYTELFLERFDCPTVPEFVLLLLLGFLLGWLMFPIIIVVGFIHVICRIIERVKKERE